MTVIVCYQYSLPLWVIKVYTTTLLKASSNCPIFFSQCTWQACSVVNSRLCMCSKGNVTPDLLPSHPAELGQGAVEVTMSQDTLAPTTSAFPSPSSPHSPGGCPCWAYIALTGIKFSQQVVGWKCLFVISVLGTLCGRSLLSWHVGKISVGNL